MSDKKQLPVGKKMQEDTRLLGYAFNAILLVELTSGNLKGAMQFIEDLIINKDGLEHEEVVDIIENYYDVKYLDDNTIEDALERIVDKFLEDIPSTKVEGLRPGMELPLPEEVTKIIEPLQEEIIEIRKWLEHYGRLDHILKNIIIQAVFKRYPMFEKDDSFDMSIQGDTVTVRENPMKGMQGINRTLRAVKTKE